MLTSLSGWITTLSLIFGGCCSNAITLEQITSQNPHAGSILTFLQFLIIALHGLPTFLIWTRLGPRFKPRRVPITAYIVQVALFYLISLLNNAAFAYQIPMAVHIIFRSGGLMISLLFGWLISKKRYTATQVLSVFLVTLGVILTTFSAQPSSKGKMTADTYTYSKGIGILTLALVLSGALGLVQDWSFTKYGRPTLTSKSSDIPPQWKESMFYLHLLGLPMFLPLLPKLAGQMHELSVGPRSQFDFPIPIPTTANLTTAFPMNIIPPYSLPRLPIQIFQQSENASLLSITQDANSNANAILVSVSLPHIYLPLVLNTVTQLLCVAGVHRLTTRVSALTVTLVLVVRKAASLIISVIGISKVGAETWDLTIRGLKYIASSLGLTILEDGWSANMFGTDLRSVMSSVGGTLVGVETTKRRPQVDNRMMWAGAFLVMLGTVGYTIGSQKKEPVKEKKKVE
ncbi:UDP-xylose and UDP-N-acetylglucosamine transporter [Psilocybe cubensis]|uniref:UDP-xylose and UDP-N-acetylglucosamine transporter n=2 Tax=Psilocybe cubensis TaxID=181762 RepID=A0ACB8H5D4_PSICU|nr:UDP-xylose and UDP-N-acetylglucosamine transporter [Psilocybe cubensis]KAH9483076.1 UDP-xylose and UDP-N-acetylglucosamine transporter [Psilocybe cubensis]